MRAAEEELLARVRDALGAKHVIRVCSSYDQARAAAVHGLFAKAQRSSLLHKCSIFWRLCSLIVI